MGLELSVAGNPASQMDTPLYNYLVPVETFRPLEVIFENPLGNLTKMRDENDNNTEYLVKTIYLDMGQMQNSIAFFQEVQNLSLSFHPTILPFAGFSVSNPHSGRRPCIAFDNYSGMTLSGILEMEANKVAPENWNLTSKIITSFGIALGLNYMHSYNFIHGNLNADSIVFGDELWPYIANFSLNNFFNEESLAIIAPKQQLLWRAPELNLLSDKTLKADVYAFGMLVFHIFCGKTFYEQVENSPGISEKIHSATRPKIANDVPNEIKKIIQSCWVQEPNNRPTMANVVKLFEESVGAIPNIKISELEKFREKVKNITNDITKARNAMTAAASGDSGAQNNYGVMLLNGKGVRKNVSAAARYFQESAENNCIEGINNYAYALENGAGIAKDVDLAAKYFKMAADKGNKNAQNSYAQMLYKGNGVEKNTTEAAKYFRLAAQQNSAPAQYRLGLLHETGEGTTLNCNESLRCYKAAAVQKYPPAMYRYSYLVINRKVDYKNLTEAYKNILASAQMGYPRSFSVLGAMHVVGEGAPKNIEAAKKQFEKAIEKKENSGYFGLFLLDLISKDKEIALKDLGAANESGYFDAQKVYASYNSVEIKQGTDDESQKGNFEKESVIPLHLILKGSQIEPTIDGIVKALKEL